MPQSPVARALNAIIEGCWLLAVVTIPIFFNIWSRRVFEPDKIVVLRNIVLVMAAALLIKFIVQLPYYLTPQPDPAQPAAPARSPISRLLRQEYWLQHLRQRPVLIPVVVFLIVYGYATLHSIDPYISFWGSYERLQGYYTWMNYIFVFIMMLYFLKTWVQMERLISAIIFASFPVALYGIVQHYQLDPLPWGGDVTTRVASSLGNPIFLGAYLLMVIPLVIYRILMEVRALRDSAAQATPPAQAARGRRTAAPAAPARRSSQLTRALVLYLILLFTDLLGTYYTFSRGPVFGLVGALLVFGFLMGMRFASRSLQLSALAAAAVIAIVLGLANLSHPIIHASSNGFGRLLAVTSTDSGTTEVRTLIWKGSFQLIKKHPLFGYGPETMLLAYNPVYPPALGHIEAANAAPDRNHDEEMDFLVMSGVTGLAAYLFILGMFFWLGYQLWRRETRYRETVLLIALVSIVIGHIVEGSVGIAIVSTLLLLWVMIGIMSVLYLRLSVREAAAAASATVSEAAPTAGAARGGSRSTGSNRRPPARPAMGRLPSWDTLAGGSLAGAIALASVSGLLILSGVFLASYNVSVVSADVTFKQALGDEAQANQYITLAQQAQGNTTQARQYLTQAFQIYSIAIGQFQQAAAAQPQQDFYDLFLGKTWLERVQNDAMLNATVQRDQDLHSGEAVLLQAEQINPLDSDHSANLARLYHLWASYDTTKYPLSLQWFTHATDLAPHNSILIDEMGTVQREYGAFLQQHNQVKQGTQYIQMAVTTFKRAANVDPQSSDARALLGDTEFVYLHNYAAAVAAYQDAIRVNPAISNPGAIHTNIAYADNALGNYTQAISEARTALTLVSLQTSQAQLQAQDQAIINAATAALNARLHPKPSQPTSTNGITSTQVSSPHTTTSGSTHGVTSTKH